MASPERAPRHVVITSCEALEGKSTVATNLAIALTQLGRRVVIVDADLRRPRVHKVLGVPNELGLSSFLSGKRGRRRDPPGRAASRISRSSRADRFRRIPRSFSPPRRSTRSSRRSTSWAPSITSSSTRRPCFRWPTRCFWPTAWTRRSWSRAKGRTTHQALASGAKRLRQSRARILGAVLNAVVERFGNYYYYRYHRDEPAEKPVGLGRARSQRRQRKQA